MTTTRNRNTRPVRRIQARRRPYFSSYEPVPGVAIYTHRTGSHDVNQFPLV